MQCKLDPFRPICDLALGVVLIKHIGREGNRTTSQPGLATHTQLAQTPTLTAFNILRDSECLASVQWHGPVDWIGRAHVQLLGRLDAGRFRWRFHHGRVVEEVVFGYGRASVRRDFIVWKFVGVGLVLVDSWVWP